MNFALRTMLITALSGGILAGAWAADPPPGSPPPLPVPPVYPAGEAQPLTPAKAAEKKAATPKKTEPIKRPAAAKPAVKPASEPKKAEAKHTETGPARVIQSIHVRGQATISSEVVARLKQGDTVTVLEEVTVKAIEDEPARWAKIHLPAGVHVWVHNSFLGEDHAVKPNRLNLRSGPGENYSILGRVDKGDKLKVVETKGDWSKVAAPPGTYAFVAAHFLTREPSRSSGATTIARATPPPMPTPPPASEAIVVTPPAPVVLPVPPVVNRPSPPVVNPPVPLPTPPPVVAVVTPPPPVVTPPPPPEATLPILSLPPSPAEDAPLIKRTVTREGFVRGSVSIQAPTYFVLRSLEHNKIINYLHGPSTNFVMEDFRDHRVLVTGEELLDERWQNTPVINVESIQSIEEPLRTEARPALKTPARQ